MATFRKKPVAIEAQQFFPDQKPWPEGVFLHDTHPEPFKHEVDGKRGNFCIDTLEGRVLNVTPGDWIITGVKGERYPCKPDIFEATYEPVPPLDSPEGMDERLINWLTAAIRKTGAAFSAGEISGVRFAWLAHAAQQALDEWRGTHQGDLDKAVEAIKAREARS